jgi:hypothetical protein
MRRRIRFVCAAWLVAAAACSDDGLTVQDQNSSGTAADGAETTGVVTGPPTSESASQGGSGTGDTGPFDETTHGVSSTGPLSPDSSGSGTGDASGTTGGTTSESTGTTGGSTTEVCDPITDDPSGIGAMCRSDFDCLPGYTCQPFEGIVFQQMCQILCMQDCDCPMGYTCIETVDKTGIPWFQCTP